MSVAEDGGDGLVADYKRVLRTVLERRPSGMRQRLAQALGTTRSFISQITNPSYATPIPAQYVQAILEVCHFSEIERTEFLTAYRRAHPRKGGTIDGVEDTMRVVTLEVVDLGSRTLNDEFDALLRDTAEHLRRIWEQRERADDRRKDGDPPAGGDPS